MDAILEKKDFKLFFHNKETDITLPVGWTNTSKGMLTKCKKLLRDNEGSYFEYTFENKSEIRLDLYSLAELIESIYKEEEVVAEESDPKIGDEEKPNVPEIAEHVITPRAEPGYLFCSSKKCNNQIKIKGNLEYKHSSTIYLVCPECGHKTKVSKVERTNSLSYAVGEDNKGTLIRFDGPKQHMNKKSRLRLKSRTN